MQKTVLHLELLQGELMTFHFKGDPYALGNMLSEVMKRRDDLVTAIVTPVLDFILINGLDANELIECLKKAKNG